MLTWEAVVHAEPRLARILESASVLAGREVAEPHETVVTQFKRAVESIVGWERAQTRGGPDWLFDSGAYDVACQRISAELARMLKPGDLPAAPVEPQTPAALPKAPAKTKPAAKKKTDVTTPQGGGNG